MFGRGGGKGEAYNPLTKKVSRWPERIVIAILFMASSIAVLATVAILYTLIEGSYSFFTHPDADAVDFFTGREWIPTSETNPSFGVIPLLNGTLLIAGGTILLAGPIGIGAALFLSEFAGNKLRSVLKPVIELLAGIPSIVYGFFAVIVISPILQDHLDADYFNAASAIVVMTFMVLPIVVSISDDAMKAVPRHMREASLAMGATKWETSIKVVLPTASSGIAASILLGLARAIGETMVVALAAGQQPSVGLNPFRSVLTMTSYIASVATGDIPPGTAAVEAAFAVGLYLFVITYIINRIAGRVVLRIKSGGSVKKTPPKYNFITRLIEKRRKAKVERMIKNRAEITKSIESGNFERRVKIGLTPEKEKMRLKFRHFKGKVGVGSAAISLILAVVFLIILLVRT
ncbi:MAG: phosphate ABC transporter permease subunit PstC, partial [Thermoplasmatota archaeon]